LLRREISKPQGATSSYSCGSKACAKRNAAVIHGCKDFLDNLPTDLDEILRQGLVAEKARLPEDETPDTEERDHDMDAFYSDRDDG
jgi:hypothetical protein